jgi:peptidoglycan/LPS O-acetylase OafA/YrhL
MKTESTKNQKRWPELDGLRGAAILMVVLLHYITDSRTHQRDFGLLYRFAQLFRLGWSGVDLFFVLSGFLIGGILLDARSSPVYFRTFYIRRIHRILPIYYLWVFLYAVVGYSLTWWAPHAEAAAVGTLRTGVYFLFLQNIVPLAPVSLFVHYFVSPTWSLAVEEQFYLVSPVVIRFLTPQWLTRALVACIVAAPVLRFLVYRLLTDGPNRALVLMPCRADALAMGMLTAFAWRAPAKRWLIDHLPSLKAISLILLLGAAAIVKWMPGPANAFEAAMQYSWIAMLYTSVLMITLLDEGSLLARFARWKLLRECGRISFCVYLIHLAILGMCHWVFFRSLPHLDDWPGFFVTILAAALTWTLARLSWGYFEKPLIDRGHSYTYSGQRSL